jgi:acyl-CoA synthetase (NDP forming)
MSRPVALLLPERLVRFAAESKGSADMALNVAARTVVTARDYAHCPKPSVPGIAVVSHSGGISSLTADMCGQAGLDLPPLGEEARDGINGILKDFGWAANPADVTGFANAE